MSVEDHFASFPGMIPELCIRAGSREGDVVLDPFVGTGTTLLQASILVRQYIGFDLNEICGYCEAKVEGAGGDIL
jgi:DNA modification methylase